MGFVAHTACFRLKSLTLENLRKNKKKKNERKFFKNAPRYGTGRNPDFNGCKNEEEILQQCKYIFFLKIVPVSNLGNKTSSVIRDQFCFAYLIKFSLGIRSRNIVFTNCFFDRFLQKR